MIERDTSSRIQQASALMSNFDTVSSNLNNQILQKLTFKDLHAVLSHARRVHLALKETLYRAGDTIEHVYFVETGNVSMITTMGDGSVAEAGLVGREGFVGMPVVLGGSHANLQALVQVDGSAWRMSTASFLQVMGLVPTLRDLLLLYTNSFMAQVAQTAACNALHTIDRRLARWLLMTSDRVGSDRFPMTHDLIARMLGVQRPGVTLAIAKLLRTGHVRTDRGHMEIVDRAGLEAAACECYSTFVLKTVGDDMIR